VETFHEQDIYGDIGCGGYGQKVKRGFRIAQCGENSGGNIVKEYKGKPPYINVQIQAGIREDIFRCPNQVQQRRTA
jgi:hypothetical protein